jgi:hypothetical protein
MSNKHNLLYKTWTAGLRRWKRRRRRWLLKKRKNAKKTYKKCTYVYIAKECDLLQDRPIREDAPWQKPQLSWLQPKSGHESYRGSVPRWTYWPTNHQLQSNSDSFSPLTFHCHLSRDGVLERFNVAAALTECTKEEEHSVIWFLWS